MPEETSEETQRQIVELKKAGKSYSQIRKETGIKHDGTIAKVLKKAGLTRPPPVAVEASTGGLAAFQPPTPRFAKPAPAAAQPASFQCSSCGDSFQLEPGEDLEAIEACPGCGEAFE